MHRPVSTPLALSRVPVIQDTDCRVMVVLAMVSIDAVAFGYETHVLAWTISLSLM